MASPAGLVGVVLTPLAGRPILGAHRAIEASGGTRFAASVPVPPCMSITHDRITSFLTANELSWVTFSFALECAKLGAFDGT